MPPLPADSGRRRALAALTSLAFGSLSAGAAHAAAAAAQPVLASAAAKPPVFVLNSLDANVSVIDPVSWTETKRIATGKEPHRVYLTPDEKSLLVASSAGDSIIFIDPRTAEVQRTVRGMTDPYHLRFSPDMKWFVTVANRLNHIDIYRWDGRDFALATRIPSGRTPSHIWIDGKSRVMYTTMQDSDELVAVDLATQTVLSRTPTGRMPADVHGTADDRFLLAALTGSDGVDVFDISGPQPVKVRRIRTADGAHAFRAAGDKRHLFVSNRVANSISKIDLGTLEVVGSIGAPGGPDCMDVSADGRLLLVTSRWAKKLTVIDLQQQRVVQQVRVGRSPHGVWTLDHAAR